MSHDDLVEDLYQDVLDRDRWDIVDCEVEYYSVDPSSMYFKNPMGELDVMGLDLDQLDILYLEAKTRLEDVEDGVNQLERAREFFESQGYGFIGRVWVKGYGVEEDVVSRQELFD
jgi:Holliday junction resolvase-like predicted endonuclease